MVALSPRVATLIWAPRGSDVLRLEVIAAQHAAGRLARTAVDARVIVGSGHRRSARDAWRQRRDPPLGCSFLAGTAFAKFEAESLFLGNAFTSNSAKAGSRNAMVPARRIDSAGRAPAKRRRDGLCSLWATRSDDASIP